MQNPASSGGELELLAVEFNPVIGAVEANAERICRIIAQYAAARRLLVFPELALTGYSPRDLLTTRVFLTRLEQGLAKVTAAVKSGAVILGTPFFEQQTAALYNSAVLLQAQRIEKRVNKCLLPNYDIFDEERYFTQGLPGGDAHTLSLWGLKFLLFICEDIWFSRAPMQGGTEHGSGKSSQYLKKTYVYDPLASSADDCAFIIVLSASPYTRTKLATRLSLAAQAVALKRAPLLYVNQCGANDEWVYDGRSFYMPVATAAQPGASMYSLPGFNERVLLLHITLHNGRPAAVNAETAAAAVLGKTKFTTLSIQPATAAAPLKTLTQALCAGIRDYTHKTGFTKALLGLSGGIDSALTLVLAAAALGPENVLAVALPSPYSSAGSVEDAKELTRRLGVSLQVVPINASFQLLKEQLSAQFAAAGSQLAGLTEENLQARLRGLILMAYSNQYGQLLLAAGNKSELAVGYATLYGDMNGALAVIGDLFKTEVYELAAFLNTCEAAWLRHMLPSSSIPLFPQAILTKAPSAELRPGQVDTDSLPPYANLDAILSEILLAGKEEEAELIAAGFAPAQVRQVLQLVHKSEYKRFQAPPVLKVSEKAFGSGRRIPIVKA